MGDFEKKFPASACRKKKIACSTNVIEKNYCTALKKYPTHQVARKKNLAHQKSPTPLPPQKLNGRPLSASDSLLGQVSHFDFRFSLLVLCGFEENHSPKED